MQTRSTIALFLFLLFALGAFAGESGQAPAPAQAVDASESIDPRSFIHVDLPDDSPFEVVRLDYGSTRITRRESSLQLELNLALTLRNRSGKPVEGVALALGSLKETGALGLSAISGIRLERGEVYTVPAKMQADFRWPERQTAGGPRPSSIGLRLDAVLFSDGTGYGPDVTRTLSAMRLTQAESSRERRFFEALYNTGGMQRVIPALERWAGEASRAAAADAERAPRVVGGPAGQRARSAAQPITFRTIRFPGAPVEIVGAAARGFSMGIVDPSVEIRNVSGKRIADVQLTWLVRDARGVEYRVATLSESARPRPDQRFALNPGDHATLSYPSVIEIGATTLAPVVSGKVYLRGVQYSDGSYWVPDRPALESAGLPTSITLSPEVIRLFHVYRARGAPSLLAEIRH